MKRKPVHCTKCGILCSHSKHSDGSRTWYCPNNHGQMKREDPVEDPDAEIARLKARIEAALRRFISRAATEEDRADSAMRLECAQLREKVARMEEVQKALDKCRALCESCWSNAKGGGIDIHAPDELTLTKAIQAIDRAKGTK